MFATDSAGEFGLYLPPCFDPQTEGIHPLLLLLPGIVIMDNSR